ncbi:MAG: T9SS type A sorting domain-containing protein [Ignavibacteriae bacterium]|nr:T9SS type A sorting domain-containing protein [Ignavibacteriota bacterium]
MRRDHPLFAFCLLAFLAPLSLRAQDNPTLDTPPLQPLLGPTPTPSSVMVITTPDGFDNFNLGTTNAEPHMASNPLNPAWHFNAFNTNTTFHSEDGYTWATNNPSFPNAAGDPVAAYDSLGNLFYETMKSPITGCWVVTSANNGQTWSSAVSSVEGVDKNWIAADQTMGPFANYVYTTMTRNGGGGSFARSTDHGATWTTTFQPTTHSLPGMMVAVGPNVLSAIDTSGGCVYVVTHSGSNAAGVYNFFVSKDGGFTFTAKSSVQFANLIGTELSGRSTVQGMRCRPYPMIAADNSFGPNRGRLYLVYASNNPAGNGNKSDIFLRYSTDQGATWSSAAVVNDDPNSQNNYQFHPAIWCDKQTGRLYIKFYDTRRVPTSDSTDVYATYTDDGGLTFAPNQRLTNRTFKINISGAAGPTYRGDYDAITSNRYAAMAVWTDFRNAPSPNYTGMTAYLPDFAMLAQPARDTLKNTDSTTIRVKIPEVKLYTYGVKFTATVSSGPFILSWPQGDSLAAVPDSLTLKVKTNNVPDGNYMINIVGRGPNGTPIHQRTVPIRVQYIPNAVTVLQPNGGEVWIQGQVRKIRWRKSGDVDTVRIEYSTNNGSSWNVVNANVQANVDSLSWTIPASPTTQARVRISWIDSTTTIRDQSDTTFVISAPAALISTAPDSLRAVVQHGNNVGFDTLRISNTGTVSLNWTTTGPTWANGFPASGSVPADSTRRAPVRFSANGLLGGTYWGNLSVASNDPFHATVLVPLRLTVMGIAQVSATPRDTLNFGPVRINTTDTLTVRVRNIGTDTLRTTCNVTPPGRFATLTPTLKVGPNDSSVVRVIFTPLDSTLSYSATLRMLTNDPDPADDTVFVALRGRGHGFTSVALRDYNLIPETYVLEQNYPNPFNPSTTIRFGIPTLDHGSQEVTLKIYDLLGREIATLVNDKLSAGTYSAAFETTGLASGMYLYKLQAGSFVETKRMLLVR